MNNSKLMEQKAAGKCIHIYGDAKCSTPRMDCKECKVWQSQHKDELKKEQKATTSKKIYEKTKPRQKKWGNFRVTQDIEEAYDDARAEVQALNEEMETWDDNLQGSSLSNTNKAEHVSEAHDHMDSAWQELEDWAKVPDSLKGQSIQFIEIRNKCCPRWVRASNAASILTSIVELIKTRCPNIQNQLKEFKDACDNADSELGDVSFPGMY